MNSDQFDIVGEIELSRATLRKLHHDLHWAIGYNVVTFAIVAGVFYPFMLAPSIATIAMSGSTAIVTINVPLSKRVKLGGIRVKRPGDITPSANTTPPPSSVQPGKAFA